MKAKIIFISIFLLLGILFSNNMLEKKSDEIANHKMEELIDVYGKSFSNVDDAIKHLRPLKEGADQTYGILQEFRIANAYSNEKDSTNNESEKLYMHSIESAQRKGDPGVLIWANLNYITYLYKYRSYRKMLPVLLTTVHLLENTPEQKIIYPEQTFKQIGWIMQTFQHYDKSTLYLTAAKKFISESSPDYAAIEDNIANNYISLGQLEDARRHLDKAQILAKKNGDELRTAKVKGSFGLLYEKEKKYEKAVAELKEDIRISEKLGSEQNTMFAATQLARIYFNMSDLENAYYYNEKAEAVAVSKSYYESTELENLNLKIKIQEKLGRTEEELQSLRRKEILAAKLANTDGLNAVRESNWKILESDYANQLSEFSNSLQQEKYLKNGLVVLAVITGLIALFVLIKSNREKRNIKVRYEAVLAGFEHELKVYDDQLSDSKESLHNYKHYLDLRNTEIQKLSSEVDFLQSKIKRSNRESSAAQLKEILQSHLMTEENWRSFKDAFKSEHPDFYSNLMADFPDLSDSNLRVILLQKLGYNNTETAGLLGITPDAVKKSKQRLKKRLGDDHDRITQLIRIS